MIIWYGGINNLFWFEQLHLTRPNELHCVLYGIEPSSVRLDNLNRLLFKRMCSNRDCLQYLVPDQRSVDILSKLRQPNTLPGILCRTERFLKSFLPYALSNYQ
jgi:hypothetical protein